MAAFPAAATAHSVANPNNGYVLPQPPDDSISRIRFSPATAPSAFLLASSWNSCARLWRLDSGRSATPISETTFNQQPVVDACWSCTDGRSAFLCVDTLVQRWDLSTNACTPVAAHALPVRQSIHNSDLGYLASVSLDKSLRYWDVRAPTGAPMADVALADKAYAMDSVGVLMVVALADRKVVVFDVRKPTTPFKQRYSRLGYQSRCVACWPDAMGYVTAAVDGTVAVDHIQREEEGGIFTCHHDRGGPFMINAVRFNPHTGAFATAASDGHVFFWDKDRKGRARAKKFERMSAPVCDVDFFHDGSMYAYAVGYDWSKGTDGASQFGADSNYIVMQQIEEGDMTVGGDGGGGGRGGGGGYRGRGGGRGKRRGHSRRGGG